MSFTSRFFKLSLAFVVVLMTGCGDKNFLDHNAINGSILKGQEVTSDDQIAKRTVFIAINYYEEPDSSEKVPRFSYYTPCTGVLIYNDVVLTAAHCATRWQFARVIQTTNIKNVQSLTQIKEIKDAKIFHKYTIEKTLEKGSKKPATLNDKSNLNDVAILHLKTPFEDFTNESDYFNDDPSFKYFFSDQLEIPVVVAGFGRNSDLAQPYTNIPQEVVKPLFGVLNKINFNLKSDILTQPLITIDQTDKPGVCTGDSGGPLFIEFNNRIHLKAIAIDAYRLKNNDPQETYFKCRDKGLFLNLDYFAPWIKKVLRQFHPEL